MTIQEWTLFVEIVGAVGIIVTLIYLAVQVRQSNNQAIADNTKGANGRWIEVQNAMFRSEESVRFLRKAMNDYESLSPEEIGRLHAFMLDVISAYSTLYDLHQRGLIAPNAQVDTERVIVGYLKCPGARRCWNMVKSVYPPRLVSHLEKALTDTRYQAFSDFMPYLAPISEKRE